MANREGDDTVERHGSIAEQGVGHRAFADAGKGWGLGLGLTNFPFYI